MSSRVGLALFAAAALSGCFLDSSALEPRVERDGGSMRDGGDLSDADTVVDAGRDGGPADRDGDGVPDAIDLCPDVADPAQSDLDGDGIGDGCDDDRDGDGLANATDLCPERDSRGAPDEDGDGITDECDACPLDADPTQPNADGDRLGDACEDEDPARFSRVAYLVTFASSLGGLAWSDDVELSGGSVRVDTSGALTLLRAEEADHPGDYAVDVRGVYENPAGPLPPGVFAALLRWSDGPFGYALGVRAEDDVAEIARVDGGGCGFFGGSTCVETLASSGASCPDGTAFALRATAFGTDLVLDARLGSTRLIQRASDDRYAHGGVGLLVDHGVVRFDALALYAP